MMLFTYKSSSLKMMIIFRNSHQDTLKEEIYEVDIDSERIEEKQAPKTLITKQGYLLKGADTSSERMFAHIGSKSFKKRYCYLRQEVDGTYILELHKDEKQCDAKTTIVMDFCTEVTYNPKRGRFCFELKMSEGGQKSVILAAEDEAEMNDWIRKLTTVLQQNKIQEDKTQASLEKAYPAVAIPAYGTLKGLDQSLNPQLIKYGRETDMSIAQARKENRKRLFGTVHHQFFRSPSEPNIEIFKENFGHRILVKCEEIKFRLQTFFDENERLSQIEPYFTSLALYDAKAGRKLTENFYFDLNQKHARELVHCSQQLSIHENHPNKENNEQFHSKINEETNGFFHDISQEWVMHSQNAILNVTSPHPDIFIVIRIEKILQGGINQSSEPYLKTSNIKLEQKALKTIKQYAQKVGHYRMPFVWTAKPLFRMYSNELDTDSEFPALFRQDCNKLKDEEILKFLNDFRKPEKLAKMTTIPGSVKVSLEQIKVEIPKSE